MNTLAGLLRPRRGEIRSAGQSLRNVPSHRFCDHGIALVPEGRRLFTHMTVEENLDLGAYRQAARAARKRSRDRVYELFPILRDRRQQMAGSMSGGQQQMVAIGRGLMAAPRVLLLDEPSLGLAPSIVHDMFEIIVRINRAGLAVLLVEQNVTTALGIAHRAYVLEQGRIVASGLPAALLDRPEIRAAYLGI